MPVDNSGEHADLAAFKKELQEAISRKDTKFLLGILDKNVLISFGLDPGIPSFIEKWQPDSSGSAIWYVLDTILELGGIASDSEYVVPYVFGLWPEQYDPFQHVAAVRQNAPVYAKADTNGAVKARLTYEILRYDFNKSLPEAGKTSYTLTGMPGWYYVHTLDSSIMGYMHWQQVWSPVGYRAIFRKSGGQWKLAVLVAGD